MLRSLVSLRALLSFALALAPSGFSNPPTRSPIQVQGTLSGPKAKPWERLEALLAPDPHLGREPILANSIPQDPQLQAVLPQGAYRFESSAHPLQGGDVWSAAQDQVILHLGPGWDQVGELPPVLLVHGSGHNANRAWVGPPGSPGAMQTLAREGRAVFAVSFLHPHGDNFVQAYLLTRAIDRIRELRAKAQDPKALDGSFQVDLVAHSKGNLSTRIYLSDADTVWPGHAWIPDYRGDVRRYLAVGGPHRGTDLSFRFLAWNQAIAKSGAGAPLAVTRRKFGAQWMDTSNWSYFGPCFRGDAQMLADLVVQGIPFGLGSTTEPWQLPPFLNSSRDALYWGGETSQFEAPGIAEARQAAGDVIHRLEARGIDPRLELAVIYGTNSKMHWPQPDGTVLETVDHTAPGDGLVYAASAGSDRGLRRRGARRIANQGLDLNHVDLIWKPKGIQEIERLLRLPN